MSDFEKQIRELTKAIDAASEKEVKKILCLLLLELEKDNEKNIYHKLLDLKRHLLPKETPESDTVHIVFGDSVGGTIRWAFREEKIHDSVIIFPDHFLSTGPLKSLHTKQGQKERYDWMRKNNTNEFNWVCDLARRVEQSINEILTIPSTKKIIIWTCENASEQFGLRFVLYLLKDKSNEIFEINTFQAFHLKNNQPHLKLEQYPKTSGELDPKKLLDLYQAKIWKPLSKHEKIKLISEGEKFLESDGILRSWINGELVTADETRDDEKIIQCAMENNGKNTFKKAARIIGSVVGEMEQYTGDTWIEYRLKTLIRYGVFTYRSDLDLIPMRMYEVKLNDIER